MVAGLLEAVSALTILPFSANKSLSSNERSHFLISFPIVGAVFGASNLLMVIGLWRTFPALACWMLIAVPVILSGASHLVGLCKTFNAFITRGTRDNKLGTLSHEAVAVPGLMIGFCSLLGRYAAFQYAVNSTFDFHALCVIFILTPIVSRYVAVMLALASESVSGDGKAALLRYRATVIGGASAFLLLIVAVGHLFTLSLLLILSGLVTAVLFQDSANRILGKVPAPVLGAIVDLTELVMFWVGFLGLGSGLNLLIF